jgi:hypothetical protein
MVSRLGAKSTGMTVTCNGWHTGIRVEASYDKKTGQDVFTVSITGGSTGGALLPLATVYPDHVDVRDDFKKGA